MADADLPTMNEHGLLPPGVHGYSLQVIERVFAPLSSLQRRKLFRKLKDYLRDLWADIPEAEVIVDGSFVMPRVDGDLGPSDIDLIVIMPANWSTDAELQPSLYNLLSKKRVRRKYHIDAFAVAAGSDLETYWTDFFMQVRTKWCEALNLPSGVQKGIVKVLR